MIAGVGIYTAGKHVAKIDGILQKDYITWKHMVERCYDSKYTSKFPTYLGCEVSEEFKDFQSFAVWGWDQVSAFEKGFQLDKDLLLKGNKLYSRDTCVFVPAEINMLLTRANTRRGVLPVGVSMNQGKYMATVSINGRNKNLGRFATPEEAFDKYRISKEYVIKVLANKYEKVLDPRAYAALLGYNVEIDD